MMRELAEGVVEMVVAADDMGDAHVVIVDDDREHVGRRAVRAEQDQVVELAVAHRDPALDAIVDHRLALARRLEPDDEGRVGAASRRRVAPAAVDAGRAGARACAAARCAASSSAVM